MRFFYTLYHKYHRPLISFLLSLMMMSTAYLVYFSQHSGEYIKWVFKPFWYMGVWFSNGEKTFELAPGFFLTLMVCWIIVNWGLFIVEQYEEGIRKQKEAKSDPSLSGKRKIDISKTKLDQY